jgi:parallel beta-helix repeat protein
MFHNKRGLISTYVILLVITTGLVGFFVVEDWVDEVSVEAASVIVDINGYGNYTGIQQAIDNTNPGDTIYVWSGTYSENIIIDKSISLIGNGSATTIISGSSFGDTIEITADWVNVSGFKLTRPTTAGDNMGIKLVDVMNCKIISNNCTDNFCGIKLEGSEFNIIKDNQCYTSESDGIYLDYSHSNTIINNKCYFNGGDGIAVIDSDSNIVNDNWLISNFYAGITLIWSESCTVQNNKMVGCNLRLDGYYLAHFNTHTIPKNNTVDNKPVYYWKNVDSGKIPAEAGQVILANCGNVIIENFNFSDSSYGIQLGHSRYNIIRNNTCNRNYWHGISLGEAADHNYIYNNTCQNNGVGIYLDSAGYNTVENNLCDYNEYTGIYVAYYSNYNTVLSNSACYNLRGISVRVQSNNNIVHNNTIKDNYFGIELEIDSYNNQFFHNNIISNIEQAHLERLNGNNYWNNSDYEGNYWSDYKGDDNGLNGRVEGDGIGDTDLPHLDLDFYPFIKLFGWLYPGTIKLADPGELDSDGNFRISWKECNRSTGFILEEDENSNFNSARIIYNGSELSFEVRGRPNGTYFYRMKPYNDFTIGEFSNIVDITVDHPPNSPQNFTISVFPEGNILNLTWNLNQIDTKKYEIFSNTTGTWEYIRGITNSKNSFNHTGLIDGKTYYYKLRAVDFRNQFSEFSQIMEAVPQDFIPPKTPKNLSIISTSIKTIKLSWEPIIDEDLKGFNIYRSKSNNTTVLGELIGTSKDDEVSFYDDDLEIGTTYYYTITAFDEVPNESGNSNMVNSTTLFGPKSPEINKTITNVDVLEDTIDDSSINLFDLFCDANNDTLSFRCIGQKNVQVIIDSLNGTVLFQPNQNWSGIEGLTFHCSDGVFEISNNFTITVLPLNDPPGPAKIINPKDGLEIYEGELLDFRCNCNDPDLTYGDALSFNWSSNIDGVLGTEDLLSDIRLSAGVHEITLEVTDALGEKAQTSIQIIVSKKIKVDREEGEFSLVILGQGLVIFLIITVPLIIIIIKVQIVNYKFFAFFSPLYTKLKKKAVLDNETRNIIQKYISANPGTHYNSIKRELEIPNGALAYHLKTLEREGFVKSKRQGMYKILFPIDIKDTSKSPHLSESQKLIYDLIQKNPGLSQKDIAEKIDLTLSTVNYHVNTLVKNDIIQLERVGNKTKCYPGKKAS